MLRKIFHFIFKNLSPIRYARYIGVKVGKNCRLIKVEYSSEPYLINLGDHVSATKVRFETHDGGVWVFRSENSKLDIIKPISIGNNVFLGYESVIMPGVTIGNNVIVGARSVVTKNLPSGYVYAGIPAKPIKTIDEYKLGALRTGENTKLMTMKQKREFYSKVYNEK